MKNLIFLLFTICSIPVFSQQFELSQTSLITVDGTSTLTDWTVEAKKFTGSLRVNAKKSSKSYLKKGSISTISLLIPVKNIRSEKGEIMDNKIYKALKTEEFPNIVYSLINTVEFDTFDMGITSIRVSGILYVAGVKKIIQSQMEATFQNDILTLNGKVKIKLSKFNIAPPSAMFGQIETGDDITINLILKYMKDITSD